MNQYLRDKLLQKLETVSDERGYQVLDYVEFLESKYAERPPAAGAAASNPLSRFADAVEEKLRAGRVSATTIAETMSLMNKAVGVLNGAAGAGGCGAPGSRSGGRWRGRRGPGGRGGSGAPGRASGRAAAWSGRPARRSRWRGAAGRGLAERPARGARPGGSAMRGAGGSAGAR